MTHDDLCEAWRYVLNKYQVDIYEWSGLIDTVINDRNKTFYRSLEGMESTAYFDWWIEMQDRYGECDD